MSVQMKGSIEDMIPRLVRVMEGIQTQLDGIDRRVNDLTVRVSETEAPGDAAVRQVTADVMRERGTWLDMDAESPREAFESGERLRADLASAGHRWVEAERIKREKRTRMESARAGRDRERDWQGGTPWYDDEHPAERNYQAAVDEFNQAVRAADEARAEREALAKRIRSRVRVVTEIPPDLTEPALPWEDEG
ncbi:MAG: hypothetical protein R6U63_13790 [Longimicrobiales bacterium]